MSCLRIFRVSERVRWLKDTVLRVEKRRVFDFDAEIGVGVRFEDGEGEEFGVVDLVVFAGDEFGHGLVVVFD
jgi:hypothetical protein